MAVFDAYATYYDLFYMGKDYLNESRFVAVHLLASCPACRTVLELGCGTGGHAHYLSEQGFDVHGIDFSEKMLEKAHHLEQPRTSEHGALSFEYGDVRSYRNGKHYDAVVSLFHVMSYQTSNEDLRAAFETAYEHVRSGGVFLFDCWYGPAVLTQKPEERVATEHQGDITAERRATPVSFPNQDVVEVDYDISIHSPEGVFTLSEQHRMRYLFKPEVAFMLEQVGFELVESMEFETGNELGVSTWNACFVAQKP